MPPVLVVVLPNSIPLLHAEKQNPPRRGVSLAFLPRRCRFPAAGREKTVVFVEISRSRLFLLAGGCFGGPALVGCTRWTHDG